MTKLLIGINIIMGIALCIASDGYASWQGPTTALTSSWGTAAGQIGITYSDSGDDFAYSFGVSQSGNIVIADSINEVLHVFGSDGTFQRDIVNPLNWRGWPGDVLVNDECAVVGYVQFTQTFNILTGALIGKVDNMGGAKYVNADCSIIISGGPKKGWKFFSPTGQLIKTSATRPLELGDVKEWPLSNGKYQITVTYPDRVWSYIGAGMAPPYMRDVKGNLYSTGGTQAIRWSFCGKELARLSMPAGIGGDNYEQYGEAVVAPNGDVYTWKRTPTTYSIIKWTWVDDPNVPTGPDAPTNLVVAASINGLYLTWTASPQDPGCVTGYEIDQATTSGGPYTVLTTVNAGVLKYNDTSAAAGTIYYYKIRAASGTDYSPYTSEVSGKR